ncbi:hypothetical protein [Komagataeibacter sp. FNDCF1]|uniref:hypothetical protein n=1 Tax=Komagataeibacter sp. FNDCF1 TaxID=2878681 RepID=UPI001E2B8921|nr:hypothetical protein [Komagataeibacter sp. FNDCF1]MCE2565118.1 hypothetical protein [Komagataeibacter sp. FNDCF1]
MRQPRPPVAPPFFRRTVLCLAELVAVLVLIGGICVTTALPLGVHHDPVRGGQTVVASAR